LLLMLIPSAIYSSHARPAAQTRGECHRMPRMQARAVNALS
jgi:hypothetical protein